MIKVYMFQVLFSIIALALFLAFVGYVFYLFVIATPRSSYQKHKAQSAKAAELKKELDELIKSYVQNGPSQKWSAELTYAGWLDKLSFGRCLIDLDHFGDVRKQFPADLCYLQYFSQSGPGEPEMNFYDITLHILNLRGDKRKISDFVTAQKIELKDSFQDFILKKIESEKAKEGMIKKAWAVTLQKDGSMTQYSADDNQLPVLQLKNFLFLHLVRDIDLSQTQSIAFCMPTPREGFPGYVASAIGESGPNTSLWFEESDGKAMLFIGSHQYNQTALFYGRKSEKNPSWEIILNAGY